MVTLIHEWSLAHLATSGPGVARLRSNHHHSTWWSAQHYICKHIQWWLRTSPKAITEILFRELDRKAVVTLIHEWSLAHLATSGPGVARLRSNHHHSTWWSAQHYICKHIQWWLRTSPKAITEILFRELDRKAVVTLIHEWSLAHLATSGPGVARLRSNHHHSTWWSVQY